MTRLLVAASVLVAALAVAAGSGNPPASDLSLQSSLGETAPHLCKSGGDGGTKPKPHGLLMVAGRADEPPCAQGG